MTQYKKVIKLKKQYKTALIIALLYGLVVLGTLALVYRIKTIEETPKTAQSIEL